MPTCESCGNDDGPHAVCLDCLARPTVDETANFLAKALGGEPAFWRGVINPLYEYGASG